MENKLIALSGCIATAYSIQLPSPYAHENLCINILVLLETQDTILSSVGFLKVILSPDSTSNL